jgi:hypothetical protein
MSRPRDHSPVRVHPDEQAITDGDIRSAGDEIVSDALALQTWTTASGTSFAQLLDAFNQHSGTFIGRYCS